MKRMRNDDSARLPEAHCPVCNALLNSARDALGDEPAPVEGDLSVCAYCTSFLVFMEDMSLKLLTDEETLDLPKELVDVMKDLRDTLRANPLIHPHDIP